MRIDEKLTEGMTQRRRVEAALRLLPETEPAGPEVTSGCAATTSWIRATTASRSSPAREHGSAWRRGGA